MDLHRSLGLIGILAFFGCGGGPVTNEDEGAESALGGSYEPALGQSLETEGYVRQRKWILQADPIAPIAAPRTAYEYRHADGRVAFVIATIPGGPAPSPSGRVEDLEGPVKVGRTRFALAPTQFMVSQGAPAVLDVERFELDDAGVPWITYSLAVPRPVLRAAGSRFECGLPGTTIATGQVCIVRSKRVGYASGTVNPSGFGRLRVTDTRGRLLFDEWPLTAGFSVGTSGEPNTMKLPRFFPTRVGSATPISGDIANAPLSVTPPTGVTEATRRVSYGVCDASSTVKLELRPSASTDGSRNVGVVLRDAPPEFASLVDVELRATAAEPGRFGAYDLPSPNGMLSVVVGVDGGGTLTGVWLWGPTGVDVFGHGCPITR